MYACHFCLSISIHMYVWLLEPACAGRRKRYAGPQLGQFGLMNVESVAFTFACPSGPGAGAEGLGPRALGFRALKYLRAPWHMLRWGPFGSHFVSCCMPALLRTWLCQGAAAQPPTRTSFQSPHDRHGHHHHHDDDYSYYHDHYHLLFCCCYADDCCPAGNTSSNAITTTTTITNEVKCIC